MNTCRGIVGFVKKPKKLEEGNFVTKTNNIQNEQRN